jgi:hypothetical protein
MLSEWNPSARQPPNKSLLRSVNHKVLALVLTKAELSRYATGSIVVQKTS